MINETSNEAIFERISLLAAGEMRKVLARRSSR